MKFQLLSRLDDGTHELLFNSGAIETSITLTDEELKKLKTLVQSRLSPNSQ